MNECIRRGGQELPDIIVDSSGLKFSNVSNGLVNLQVSILKKTLDPLPTTLELALNDKTFVGFIAGQNPRKFTGTEYYEYAISAMGVIC